MRLFVTGGAGFIGSNFIRYWLVNHPEDTIVNFDALTYAGNARNLAEFEHDPRYTFVKGDIRDAEAVAIAMAGCDVVVHYAAETHVDRSVTGPAVFVETNVIGTQVLLDQALKQGVQRFHHVSTDEVFGSLELEDPSKFNEETPYNPSSPYSASKAGSDHLVRAYYHTYGLPITISNCSNNYGPYHFPEKLIPLMIIHAMGDQALPVYGDGLNVRDWIHTEDHARAVDLILQKGRVGETYCIGGDAERSNIYIVKKILEILGKSEDLIQYVKDRPGHDRRYAIDATKIKNELGFQPSYSLEEGLLQTVEWFKENELWWQEVISGEYQTYHQQQYGN